MGSNSFLVSDLNYSWLRRTEIHVEHVQSDQQTSENNFKIIHYYSIKNFYQPQTLTTRLKKNKNQLGVSFLHFSNNNVSVGFKTTVVSAQSLFSYFNCAFLKKEKLYTKLKYSRSPQYDIVSGGVAALFSGFLGFLVSEKFGIELVDSGDFYVLFMYVVFLVFSVRPLIKTIVKFDKLTPIVSLTPLFNIFSITVNFLYNTINFYTVRLVQVLKNLK